MWMCGGSAKSQDPSELNGVKGEPVTLLSSLGSGNYLYPLQVFWHLCIKMFYLLSFLEEKSFPALKSFSLFASFVYFWGSFGNLKY